MWAELLACWVIQNKKKTFSQIFSSKNKFQQANIKEETSSKLLPQKNFPKQ